MMHTVRLGAATTAAVINRYLEHTSRVEAQMDLRTADRVMSNIMVFRVIHKQILNNVAKAYSRAPSEASLSKIIETAIDFAVLDVFPPEEFNRLYGDQDLKEYIENDEIKLIRKVKCLWFCILKARLDFEFLRWAFFLQAASPSNA